MLANLPMSAIPHSHFALHAGVEPDHEASTTTNQLIVSIIGAFNSNGGLASGEEISILLRRHCDQPLSQLARWIVAGDIVVLDWHGQTLIPLFQFDLDAMTIRPEVVAVLASLRRHFDNEQTSRWFASPNAYLDDRKPLECISSDLPAVLKAAHAERVAVAS